MERMEDYIYVLGWWAHERCIICHMMEDAATTVVHFAACISSQQVGGMTGWTDGTSMLLDRSGGYFSGGGLLL